jgi:hypothetical protein
MQPTRYSLKLARLVTLCLAFKVHCEPRNPAIDRHRSRALFTLYTDLIFKAYYGTARSLPQIDNRTAYRLR